MRPTPTTPASTRHRRTAALLSALAITATGLTVTAAPTPAQAEDELVTLVGSLQSELGCASDWDPGCTETVLEPTGGTGYAATFTVPAGSWELKVAIGGTWDESHPAANRPLVLEAPTEVEVAYDSETDAVDVRSAELPGDATKADADLAQDSLRAPVTTEQFYFVMADRFANGDPSNDTGGITGGRLDHGFDPTDKGFYHGGDLAGLQQQLDYIEGLGTTAIWLTPSFENNPVQGADADASAGYHGYWITDFTQIDPHLGTNEEMKALIDAAHARGMKVYFDIITNHTADIIDYAEGEYSYVDKAIEPYRDATGIPFDDADYAGTDTFPEIDPATSFPYTPVFRDEADATVKTPAWLNDPRLYHNRGDSTFAGESSTHGDFIGLDDLWTERHEVVDGMIDIYSTWAEFGIDGFRIDTVKHVNLEFWQEFSPAVLEAARAGNEDFFMFGEVFDANPAYTSTFTTEGQLQGVLDFGFQARAVEAAGGGVGSTGLRDFFLADDLYTDTDSNAYQLPTFLGNHDMGRAAMLLGAKGLDDAELLQRVGLAHELMFTSRGQPVVYYGDEQGFIGAGGDKDARQDMFATQTAQYADEPVLGGPSGSRDRYDTSHPLYQQIVELSELRADHPALADGAQQHRYASDQTGLYAFSRIDREERREYLVVVNTGAEEQTAAIPTWTPRGSLRGIHGDDARLRADAEGRVEVTVPAASTVVYRADQQLKKRKSAPDVVLVSPDGRPGQPAEQATVGGRAEIRAGTTDSVFAQASFAWRPAGTSEWRPLGTDDNAPYRVFHDVDDLSAGTLVEYRVVLEDASGNLSADSSSAVVGEPAPPPIGPGGPTGPVEQPEAVSVPGDHNSEMGCAADWAPDCEQAQLTLDPDDDLWKATIDLPAGPHAYKAAVNRSWDENYGAGAVRDGANISYTAPGGPVTFYYDHATHWVTSDAQGPILTAPGSMQSELGCPADWSPDCMRPWLQDPDGDGTYTWSSTEVPAGSHELKVAHGLGWDESYGTPDGGNVTLTVPADGLVTTISYVLATHQITVSTAAPGSAPDLGQQRASWVRDDLLAWPSDALGDLPVELLDWRLHSAPEGGAGIDAETLSGTRSVPLTRLPDGLPEDVLEDFPHLEGYVALRLDTTDKAAKEWLTGQLAVAMYDDIGRLQDATGVQVPGVLDNLYADAADADLGVTWQGRPGAARPSLRLWAPTAKDVDLLVWPGAGAETRPVEEATRVQLRRDPDGTWLGRGTPRWNGAHYLYEVRVYVPETDTVETTLVTDPYSVALTLDSTRSVLVDLRDPDLAPEQWRSAEPPTLSDEVDQSIYELHVRDFSIGDEDVPAEQRGSYLAFAADGNGTRHLRELADAGLNTVHLLPTFDIASIPEDPADQRTPGCDLAALPPDSPEQQACIAEVAAADAFNWGYDPWHFMAPEGSYASTAQTAHGGQRVTEFRAMVGGLHDAGLRVVLDQVYNHTAASGQAEKSVLDKVVPGYYHRLDAVGEVETSTCCQNVATEHAMAQKLMVDSTVLWARDYKVDGFRFDLMGHHSRENMLAVRAALDELTVARDGVDGSAVTLYGEGWNFGEVADNARFTQATQGQLDGTHIATFNDRLRDGVRGGGPFDEDPRTPGFGSGGTDPNDTDLVQIGLTGNLRDFELRSAETGEVVSGEEIGYNGAPAGYATDPDEVVTYVDAHDNETLFDALTFKLPPDLPMEDRVRMNTVSLATATLGQGVTFWHAGTDLLRSKSLDRNSYDSGDWFNSLDFTRTDNGFGRGLPPAPDNEDKWDYMRPLLADPDLKPAPADIDAAAEAAQDLLRLRYSSPLFRLGSAEAVEQKVSFPVSGTADGRADVIVLRIDDTVGADADPERDGLLVVFNASGETLTQTVPGLEGAELELSAVQADGADEVVKGATWDAEAGAASVPPRTVAVFEQR
ncbi:pullulanase-type alpha-1,6-glucosidase [Desertihabitans aurantiacus]|uniref:pullulanase-type alpha-1,6-glucosidase n=1 Tax=Desertihabitans aurantiacus TaxID=2282477 RepID=UPI000DF75F80|nr:pullulanase-type alpha-1,6-glucosidase [Desertihabitans aurantiacus]